MAGGHGAAGLAEDGANGLAEADVGVFSHVANGDGVREPSRQVVEVGEPRGLGLGRLPGPAFGGVGDVPVLADLPVPGTLDLARYEILLSTAEDAYYNAALSD